MTDAEVTARWFSPIRRFATLDSGQPFSADEKKSFLGFAIDILNNGIEPLQQSGITTINPYDKPIVHPDEIRGVNEALTRIRRHISRKERPLNIVVLSPPGGGKSTVVEGLVNAVKDRQDPRKEAIKLLKFNASQYENEDFRSVWEAVRLESASVPVLCFIDEFDVRQFRWVPNFLAPMNDGAAFVPHEMKFGPRPVIFVFGGGLFETADKLKREASRHDKLIDFIRRVDVWLELKPIAFPWDHSQDALTMATPVDREVIATRNVMVDWLDDRVILQQSRGDSTWNRKTRRIEQRDESKIPRLGFDFRNGQPSVSGTRRSHNDGPPRLIEIETFFALLKRVLFLRHQIERCGLLYDNSARAHRFDINRKKVWIDTDPALFLLHPRLRLRDGMGSLEKFVKMIDFRMTDRFRWAHLPHFSEYRDILAIGPEVGTAIAGWTQDDLRNEMRAIQNKTIESISWPPAAPRPRAPAP